MSLSVPESTSGLGKGGGDVKRRVICGLQDGYKAGVRGGTGVRVWELVLLLIVSGPFTVYPPRGKSGTLEARARASGTMDGGISISGDDEREGMPE